METVDLEFATGQSWSWLPYPSLHWYISDYSRYVIRKLRQEDQSSKPAWATWQDLISGRECSSLVECLACPRLWVRFSAGSEVLELEGLGSNSVKMLCKAGLIICHPNSTISACQTQITLTHWERWTDGGKCFIAHMLLWALEKQQAVLKRTYHS